MALRDIGRRWLISYHLAWRHKRRHLAKAIAKAENGHQESAQAIVRQVIGELRGLADSCLEAKVGRDYLRVADRIIRAGDALGRLTGEAQPEVVIVNQLGVSVQEAKLAVEVYQKQDDEGSLLEAAMAYLERRLESDPSFRETLRQRLQLGEHHAA